MCLLDREESNFTEVDDNKVNSNRVNQVVYNIDKCLLNLNMGKYPAKILNKLRVLYRWNLGN
jgi:hypothetical protein